MHDYTIFYRTSLSIDSTWPAENKWDVFISAYTAAERVQKVFDKVDAETKHWIVLPEYKFNPEELPKSAHQHEQAGQEAECISSFWKKYELETSQSICIDTTGFLRPYLIFLVGWLKARGYKCADMLYSEPIHYVKKERTEFSGPNITEIRQIAMFEGIHSTDTTNDLLIINAGYENDLISMISEFKNNAKRFSC